MVDPRLTSAAPGGATPVGKIPAARLVAPAPTARHRLQLKRVRVLQDQTEAPGAIIRSPHRRELANIAEH
jgi:hypothetical protein